MGMSVGPAAEEDSVNSTINTTPLVDVMLVLLIIFLITIPVVTKTIELELPIISNEATQTKPENIIIQIDRDGRIYWNDFIVQPDSLVERMKAAAVLVPQPEVHIRGDQQVRYEFIGRVVASAQRGGIMKVGFITDPELRGE
ncbi:MAG: ExbD/TolR family protein [Rhodospirillaceae bacterium]